MKMLPFEELGFNFSSLFEMKLHDVTIWQVGVEEAGVPRGGRALTHRGLQERAADGGGAGARADGTAGEARERMIDSRTDLWTRKGIRSFFLISHLCE